MRNDDEDLDSYSDVSSMIVPVRRQNQTEKVIMIVQMKTMSPQQTLPITKEKSDIIGKPLLRKLNTNQLGPYNPENYTFTGEMDLYTLWAWIHLRITFDSPATSQIRDFLYLKK